MAVRYLAQRITTGVWLHTDVPLQQGLGVEELSGPGGVFGQIDHAFGDLLAADGLPVLEEWSTALYGIDADGEIERGGIVTNVVENGEVLAVEAPGFSSYPAGQPYIGAYTVSDWEDPVTVFKRLWAHLMSFPNTPKVTIEADPTYMILGDGAGPYNFGEQEYRDVGAELDSITEVANFDWVESHRWANAARTQVEHVITIGFPRLGARRDDLRFAEDENVTNIGESSADGDSYCNDLVFLGLGEGYAQAKHRVTVIDGRLRRAQVVTDKRATPGRVKQMAEAEMRARSLAYDISDFTVTDHPHAPLDDIHVGDEVWLNYTSSHRGKQRDLLRVLSIERSDDTPGTAVLKTMRADYFIYSSPDAPVPGEPFLVTM